MFKKEKEKNKTDSDIRVQSIPMDFYAGANPVIKFKKVEQEVILDKQKARPAEKALLDKKTTVGANKKLHPANLLSRKKFFIVSGIFIFVLFVVGSTSYYTGWYKNIFNKKTETLTRTKVSKQIVEKKIVQKNENNIVIKKEEVKKEEPAVEDLQISKLSLDFPSILLGDSVDLDDDGLTDKTEEIFNTDPSLPDTDKDSFSDSHEVFYLYNPAGKEPNRLIASGLVKDYQNPYFNYKLYYPTNWAVGDVNSDGRQILFSALSGENIEVRVFDLKAGETFADWFANNAKGERYDYLLDFQSYFKENGKIRKDNLVSYFTDERNVYMIVYHTLDKAVVNYRDILEMMARSFRTSTNKSSINLLEQL